ncbi:MAG: creatininase family protein [Clostridia bacterium]
MYLSKLNMSQFNQLKESIQGVVIPIGSTEAHGPHCPYGTDFLIPDEIANRLNDSRESLLITPTINFGASWDLGHFPGTISLSSETLTRVITEVGNDILKWDLNNIIILNGHGGNNPAIRIASQHLANNGAKVLVINWWLDYQDDILKICESKGHAGEDETSAVLAIDSSLVDMDLAPKNTNIPIGKVYASEVPLLVLENAITGDATKASKEKGNKMLDLVREKVNTQIEYFLAGKYIK